MKKASIFLFLSFLIGIFCLNVIADDRDITAKPYSETLKSDKEMPILAWSGLPLSLSTVERFKEVRDAGFTHHLQVYGKLEDMKKVLAAAERANVKIFLNVLETKPEKEFFNEITKYPALEGYFITDEPSDTASFAKWGEVVKSIQSMDTKHWCYINLLPTYGMPYIKNARNYKDYVDKFLKQVPVKILTFDHYPIVSDGKGGVSIRDDFYENLEIIKNVAEKFHKPFWGFVLSVAHWGYPVPTMAHLRYQAYSNLVYGAQGIQYFTYWTVSQKGMNFNTAPLDKNGKKTVVYERAKIMNKELQAMAGVFMGSKVVSVSHTGKSIPKGTRRYRAKGPLKILKTTGPGAVVSELKNGDRRFMVVLNRNVEKPMTLTVAHDTGARIFEVGKNALISPISANNKCEYEVAPGDIKVFMWNGSQAESSSK